MKMENETIAMLAQLFHGADAVGSLLSGTAESIMMTVKTYRDRARSHGIFGTLEVVYSRFVLINLDGNVHFKRKRRREQYMEENKKGSG